MGIRDVTAVFGRYFIVGFYLPSFFWLAYVKLAAGPRLLPARVEGQSASAFAIVGIVALVLGLLLQGLRRPLERLLSGYFVMNLWRSSRKRWLRAAGEPLRRIIRRRERRAYEALDTRAQPRGPERANESDDDYRARRLAEYQLERRFPNSPDKVLPTKFGNRIRAWEDHARGRWSLETVSIDAHIQSLLGQQEVELRRDAETDVSFAMNGCVLGVLSGLVLGVDRAIETPDSIWFLAVLLAPFVLARGLYELAVGAAEQWGDVVRAGIDLHRLDLLEKLSARRPVTLADDRAIGPAVNRMLLYGEVLPDEVRAGAPVQLPPRQRLPRIRIAALGLCAVALLLAEAALLRAWARME